jgi:hypothetical protein
MRVAAIERVDLRRPAAQEGIERAHHPTDDPRVATIEG